MSSESDIPLHSVVDKSEENRSEENELDEDVEITDTPQIPTKHILLRKKPLPAEPYKKTTETDSKETVDNNMYRIKATSSVTETGINTNTVFERDGRTVSRCAVVSLAVIVTVITVMFAATVVISVIAIAANSGVRSEIKAIQMQLMKIQQLMSNYSEISELESPYFIPSCSALPSSFPSGYYWVLASNGSAVRAYCDMTRSCGGVTGGWMRVAELDMTNSSHQCPSGLRESNSSDIRTCIRNTTTGGCTAIMYVAYTGYTRICGRAVAYQIGSTNAFLIRSDDINDAYVDGVSLTHGSPKEHIWTFVAALDKTGNGSTNSYCPCQSTPTKNPPSFVGNDYFCDAGNELYMDGEFGLQPEPLWDGAGCPCCAHPPWFYKQLPQPTTDNIEMRVCRNEEASNEDIAIQVVEIYVH